MRTTSWPSPVSTASPASTVSRMARSGDFPSAEMPSKSTTTFMWSSVPRFRRPATMPIDSPPRRAGCSCGRDVQLDALPFRGVNETCLNELVVAHARGTRRFRKAGIVRGVGENPGKGIDLDHVGLARRIQSDIDPRPVTTAKHAVGAEHDVFDRAPQLLSDPRGTFENLERLLWAIPDPFRLVAVHGKRAVGERFEVHSDEGKDARVVPVAEHCTGEFGAGQVFLDEHGLLVAIEEELDLRLQLVLRTTVVRFRYSLGRSFVDRLNKNWRLRTGDQGLGTGAGRWSPFRPVPRSQSRVPLAAHDGERRRRDTVVGERLLGLRLVEAQRQRERVARGVGNAVELADRGDMGLAIHSEETFGDVEDDVGASIAEVLREVRVGFESDDIAEGSEGVRDGVDGLCAIPLGELIVGGRGGIDGSGGGEV